MRVPGRILRWCCALTSVAALLYGTDPASAREGEAASRKVQVELIADVDAVRPGQAFTVALRQSIAPHWHTYWMNPGDSGEPTRIVWTLPDGFKASEILWPMPDAIPVGPLVNFGYSNAVLLPVSMTAPADLAGETVTLTAAATWLVCEQICVPESETLAITLPVAREGVEPGPSGDADAIAAALRARPADLGWTGRVTARGKDKLVLDVTADGITRERIERVRFFPEAWGAVEHASAQQLAWRDGGFTLELERGQLAGGTTVPELKGVLAITETVDGTTRRNGVTISASPNGDGSPATVADVRPLPGGGTSGSSKGVGGSSHLGIGLWEAALFALLGGLILNLMPCVLPILSLKVLSLSQERDHVMGPAMAYLAGVLASFAIFAVALAGLRSAGEVLGWGFQFQSPAFVLAMATLFFALGLSLSGVFEIGGSLVGAGDRLTRQPGLSGSFFTGVLASLAATPCTAPFMGAALGFALTRPAIEMGAILLALGLGFALPVVLISLSGAARRLVPKPGPWMVTFKQVLAFPLYATVAWLVWVLSQQAGSDGVLAAGIALTVVGFAAWFLGRPTARIALRVPVAAAIAAGGLWIGLVMVGGAGAPGPIAGGSRDAYDARRSTGAAAGVYSADLVEKLRSEGSPVFVNFTAAWCITCKVNERVALSGERFRQGLADNNIAYLKGDWTNKDDAIADVLAAHGRAGVPLYLLYPADTSAEPAILPQLLTEAIVLRHFAAISKTSPMP